MCESYRVRVEDVQVIGYDGIRHFGNLSHVCSAIVQPVEEKSKALFWSVCL